MRSAGCAEQVASTGDAALRVNSGGKGPVSAEWMIPKVCGDFRLRGGLVVSPLTPCFFVYSDSTARFLHENLEGKVK